MTQEEILDYNKRCAEFLGWFYENHKWLKLEPLNTGLIAVLKCNSDFDLKFHSDWNWIMDVVEAIETLKTETSSFEFHFQPKSVLIKEDRNFSFEKGDGGRSSQPLNLNNSIWITGKSKKEAVVQAINQFLIWYNENNKR